MDHQKEIQIILDKTVNLLEKVREIKPLIHMIPNDVSAALCADAMAAIGARPIMAVAKEEVGDIVSQAKSLVINSGQLTKTKQEAMEVAMKAAIAHNRLLVLDPVGAGASTFRLEHAKKIVEAPWQGILKVNTSEYQALVYECLTYTGVDGIQDRAWLECDQKTNGHIVHNKTICVTGEFDRVWNGERWTYVGHYPTRLPRIVGSGCMLGALCGVFIGVTDNSYDAAVSAALVSGVASQLAEKQAKGYADYKMYLLDAFYNLDATALQEYGGILLKKGAQNGKDI